MESKFLKTQLDDVIFESRNKAYGAYALRQSYGKQMKRGIIGGLSLFALLVTVPLIANRMAAKGEGLNNKIIEMVDIPKDIEKPIPPPPAVPPPPPPPPVKHATIGFTPPVVTEEVETEPPMPRIEDITVNVAAQTQKGENVEAFVNVVEAPATPPIDVPTKPVDKPETTFVIVEQMPEYKDGMKAMFQFLADNIKYPAIARENGIDGTVYVGFVVWNDGSIRNVEVKRGRSGGLNEEAARVIAMMPNWKPGRQNGKAVNVAFTVPIKFTLN
jgi:periplasmic protein TonB